MCDLLISPYLLLHIFELVAHVCFCVSENVQLMRLSPQNGSTLRAPLLLSSRIDFEVHIISWQSVQRADFSSNS